ncbi:DUF3570 domain-containing protein [Sulfurimonas sp. SAG-AH-194-L11]|nr:DUF3570 domain-containing protein [Sulfurimonas sp. SAG-AH-194-L11]MDF1876804.1 DUF3570 domain-containing protein [Sulfurimonas sp. SAG-AH-194-L11]
MQIKYFFTLIFSLLLLEISSLASNLKDSASIGFDTYSDTGDVQVYSPTLSLFKRVSTHWMIGFKMRIDAITAASIQNGASAGNVDVVTGASQKEDSLADDTRYAPTAMATYDDGINSFTLGAYYSQEIDYEGKALFFNYVKQLNEQNTAVGIGFSQSADKWKPVFDRALPKDNRDERKIDLSINQLFTPGFSMQAVYSYMYSEGFLSSPYHYVLQENIAKFENYPDTRVGHAMALKGVYLLNSANAMNFSYRYYFDDWDISSHTLNVEVLHDFSSSFTSGVRLRYYTQTASSFVQEIGNYSATDSYFATDYRMSAFDSYTIGIPFIHRMKGGDKLTASIDYYETTNNNFIKVWYGVDKLQSIFTTLTYEFEY